MVADVLAKMGSISTTLERARLLAVPPVYGRHALWTDTLGTTFERSVRSRNDSRIDQNYKNFLCQSRLITLEMCKLLTLYS